MKRRYSIYLSGTLTNAVTSVTSFGVDMRTIIPTSEMGQKFILSSSLHTTSLAGAAHSCLEVGVNLPSGVNKSVPHKSYTVLGVANPTLATSVGTGFLYSFSESECFPRMVEYPDISQIDVTIVSLGGQAMAAVGYTLSLTFEVLE